MRSCFNLSQTVTLGGLDSKKEVLWYTKLGVVEEEWSCITGQQLYTLKSHFIHQYGSQDTTNHEAAPKNDVRCACINAQLAEKSAGEVTVEHKIISYQCALLIIGLRNKKDLVLSPCYGVP